MLKARRPAALLMVAVAGFGLGMTACERKGATGSAPAAAARELPSGDAVWFEDGIAASEVDIDKRLTRSGFASVFLPGVRLARDGGRWTATELLPPSKPLEGVAVFLVVVGGPDLAQAVAPADAAGAEAMAATVAGALEGRLKSRDLFGSRVAGVHLDFPFAPGSAAAYGSFLRSLRGRMPGELLLTVSLRFAPAEGETGKLGSALAAADGFVAVLFGEMASGSPVRTDEVGKPWWAAYCPGSRGTWKTASGQNQGTLAEKYLLRLSDDPRVELTNDLTFREEAASAYLLSVHQPLTVEGTAFGAGDRLAFRQPALPEMLYRFGADLAGRRRVRGRVVVLPGSAETDRIFTLGALSDVILGRSLDPDLRVTVTGARSTTVVVSAYNASTHASVISRSLNWVDVDLPGGEIRDVQTGGFDHYDLYDAQGHSVTPGRATRVRFYETLVGPLERIEPAKVFLRQAAPGNCCNYRQAVVSAAGPEVKTDWVVPTPAPTPVPKRPAPSKKKGR